MGLKVARKDRRPRAVDRIDFERTVTVEPGYERRSDDPNKNYGICPCKIRFVLKGPKGAVQFLIGTDWYPKHVQEERRRPDGRLWESSYRIRPNGWDIGYHSPVPRYEGQDALSCTILASGKCYYDGSSLRADEWIPEFLTGGTDWLWPQLEREYEAVFGDQGEAEA